MFFYSITLLSSCLVVDYGITPGANIEVERFVMKTSMGTEMKFS